jgi:pimeloyl-ACP methyl ester carboxylesterase
MMETAVSEITVPVGETALHLLKGGSGRPVVALHGIEGPEGWLAFHEALAATATVYAPTQPGYGATERPDWMETTQHVALFYGWFLQNAGLAPVDLVGFGVGGWIAAELAVMCPASVRRLILVDAAGLRPREGELLDLFVIPWREVVDRCFHDPSSATEYERIYSAAPIIDFGGARESGRSMAMRTCYRPYMFDPALQPLLGRISAPTLVVWGAEDQLVPVECGRMYEEAIPNASLRLIEDCGHWPHYEKPRVLAEIVREFVAR